MTRLVLVLGMHRSGTSLVSASLPALGVDMGDRLLGPAKDNLIGFWENIDILNLNQAVLRECDADWYMTHPLDFMKFQAPERQGTLRAYAAEMLQRAIGKRKIFGLKDPRMCRLLPFWRPVFEMLKLDVSCLYVVRSPEAVAASLYTRNDITRLHGLALWQSYVGDSLADADPAWPKVMVEYDHFLGHAIEEMQRIERALNLWMKESDAVHFSIFTVNAGLRHSDAPTTDMPLWDDVRAMARGEKAIATGV